MRNDRRKIRGVFITGNKITRRHPQFVPGARVLAEQISRGKLKPQHLGIHTAEMLKQELFSIKNQLDSKGLLDRERKASVTEKKIIEAAIKELNRS